MFQRNLEKNELDFVTPFVDKERKPTTGQTSQMEEDTHLTTPEEEEDLNIPKFLLEMPEPADGTDGRGPHTVDVTIAVEQHKTIKIVHTGVKPVIKSLVRKGSIKTKGIPSKLQKPEEAPGVQFEATEEPTILPAKTKPKGEPISLAAKTKGKGEKKGATSSPAKTTDESEGKETPSLPVKAKHKRDSSPLSAKTKVKSGKKMSASSSAKTMEETDKIEMPDLPVRGKRRIESISSTVPSKVKSDEILLPTLPVNTMDERENIDSILARVKAAYKSDSVEKSSSAHSMEETEYPVSTDFKSKDIEEITQGIIHKTPSKRQVLTIVPPIIKTTESIIHRMSDVTESPHEQVTVKSDTSLDETDKLTFSSHSSGSEFGEPEDVLFYEDSHEQPIVHTRVFTKKRAPTTKLPPIKGLKKETVDLLLERERKGMTFKRKMSKTMKEQLSHRKQLMPETLVQDFNELDLQQALVLTSSSMEQDSHFKVFANFLLTVFIYVCMHKCMYCNACMYECMYVCVYARMYVLQCMYACMHELLPD